MIIVFSLQYYVKGDESLHKKQREEVCADVVDHFQCRHLLNSKEVEQFKRSLQENFENEQSNGGVMLAVRLPNGEKLTRQFDISCSTKVCCSFYYQLHFYNRYFVQVLYEFVLYAGKLNQFFCILTQLPRK